MNLDPSNENFEYQTEIDIKNLIKVEDVMEHFNLGPNGGLIYCMEFLETNFDWLLNQIKSSKSNYFIFDCPGQVELYTHHQSVKNIFGKLEKLGYHLSVVHLVDSHYCSEPHKFISTLLLSLSTMLQMGLPQVNILSKADLFKEFESKLLFGLDYYTDVLDLKYLLEALDTTPGMAKYKKLNEAIVGMVEDYSLVTFQPLDSNKKENLLRVKNLIDKANGYVFNALEERNVNTMMACAFYDEDRNKDYDQYMN